MTDAWQRLLREHAIALDGAIALALFGCSFPGSRISAPGFAAKVAITAIAPAASLLLPLTTFEIDEYVAEAVRAGASGFLGKDVGADDLLAGIRTLVSGESLLSPAATRLLVTRFLAVPVSGAQAGAQGLEVLTDRERI